MALNPPASFLRTAWQLTKSEYVAALQYHSGMVGTPPDPFDFPVGDYTMLSWLAHQEWAGNLAPPYFTSATTQAALLDSHAALFSSLGAAAYLAPCVSNLTRRARLANGAILVTPPGGTRNANARVMCWKQLRQPAPPGMIRMPVFFWSSSGANLHLRMLYTTSPGVDGSTNVISTMAGAINALPAGFRCVLFSFPGYKVQLPGGEYAVAMMDGEATGGWPGVWCDNLAAGMNGPNLGGHPQMGAVLDALKAAGAQIDYWISDMETYYVPFKLASPSSYFPHPNYRTAAPGGGWLDLAGRRWYEDIENRVATDKAAWASTYRVGDLTNLGTFATDDARSRKWTQGVHLYQRRAIRAAMAAVVQHSSRYPDCKLIDYDDRLVSWLAYPDPVFRLRYGAFPGSNALYGDRQGGNWYADNPDATFEFYDKTLTKRSIGTSQWLQIVFDALTQQSMIAASARPHCAHVTPYTDVLSGGFNSPLNEPLAYTHAVIAALIGSDPFLIAWIKTANASGANAQQFLADAWAEVSDKLYNNYGVNLPTPPRTGWNPTEGLSFEHLVLDSVGRSKIVTLSIAPDGSRTWGERENVINMAPVMDPVANDTATVGVPFTKTISAVDPDYNGLAFSLVSAPAWMAIDPGTGQITGTPTSGGTLNVTVRVTDDDPDPLYDEKTFELVISGAPNLPPLILPIVAQQVNEGSLLSVQLSAEDPEDHVVTWSLVSGPTGLTVSPTGLVQWTPTEAQGPGSYSVTVRATDDGTPNESSQATFGVTVLEVNLPPTFAAIANQTVDEHALLTVTPTGASDPDIPAQTLTWDISSFTLGGSPVAAWLSINPNTGVMTGTPNELMGGNVYSVTVRLRDSGAPQLSFSRSFTITVVETNTAPVMGAIPDAGATQGAAWSYQVTASDSDVPAQALTYSLPVKPAGMAINSMGLISWTPTGDDVGGHSVTVRATDTGGLYAERSFTLTVAADNHPPVVDLAPTLTVREGQTLTYQVQASDPDSGDELAYAVTDGVGQIDAETGLFSFAAELGTAGDTVTSTIAVTDDGTPNLTTILTLTIEIVQLLSIVPLPERTVSEGATLRFTAALADVIVPPRWLIAAGPPNAQIDSSSGEFTWPVVYGQAGSYAITIRCEDATNPQVYAEAICQVTVVYGPRGPYRKTRLKDQRVRLEA